MKRFNKYTHLIEAYGRQFVYDISSQTAIVLFMRERLRKGLSVVMLLIAMMVNSIAYGQNSVEGGKAESRTVIGFPYNPVTERYVSDSIYVEILTSDSVVVATGYSCWDPEPEYKSDDEWQYWFNIPFNGEGDNFIVRMSHPDYAEISYPFKTTGPTTRLGLMNIRRLTSYERKIALGEVTVKASIVQVVNKGDTIQFNADAFEVAQGSMLDALVDQLPGVELRDNGRIYVNGRFVDKLLLDGKDFFEGDQFILLQNLPAYTVKNVQVYEQASISKEVFGFDTPTDPNLYVMDVNLKKGYNTGWIANAELGGGTHHRYRGRVFGLGYTKSLRLGLFGLMNNLNETREPGRDGNWSPAESRRGLTTAKAVGLTYNFYGPNRKVELSGNVIARYSKTEGNSLTNLQNFLSGGDTYTQNWTDNMSRDVSLSTSHQLYLRPSKNSDVIHVFRASLDYGTHKKTGNTTEGTFDHSIGDKTDMRIRLESGWPTETGCINRFLSDYENNHRDLSMSLGATTTLGFDNIFNGMRFIGRITYKKSEDREPNFSDYLFQQGGGSPETRMRSNPQNNHGYDYVLASDWSKQFGDFDISPRIDYFHTFEYGDNNWILYNYLDSASAATTILPSMRREMIAMTDPQNSYVTRLHYSNIRLRLPIYYVKRIMDGNKMAHSYSVLLEGEAHIKHNWINFHGATDTRAGRNYVAPGVRFFVKGQHNNYAHTWDVGYDLSQLDLNPLNMVDVTFNYDPLSLRQGNPDLKIGLKHDWHIYYYTGYLWNRFMIQTFLTYCVLTDNIAQSYSYDRASGVKTYRPVNINGNRMGNFSISPTISLDKSQNFIFTTTFTVAPRRSVDMVSYDDFSSSQESVVNSLVISDEASLSYSVKKFMVGINGSVSSRKTTSADNYFAPFRVTEYRYGFQGRVSLPAGFEVSTDIKMYSNRGYDYSEMNTNQLVWNGRISKSFMKGNLIASVDGYDILGRVKSISYTVNEQGRKETWVNSIPSYVMLSLRWNFAKKPRQ